MKTLTVSELIKAAPEQVQEHWVSCLIDELYRGGFNVRDWNPDGEENVESLEQILKWAFDTALRQVLWKMAPVQVNEDPEEEEE